MPHANVLVVDDEEDILELVNYNLAKEGYNVLCVDTGEDALRRRPSQAARPDPARPHAARASTASRSAACSRPTRKTQHIPIVMLTAKGGEADIVAGLELGADDYVTKPFSPRVLTGPRQGGPAPRPGRRTGDGQATHHDPRPRASTPAAIRSLVQDSPSS